MYAPPSYGFGPGTNSQPQPFNPSGTPHNPHQQQQQLQHQQHQLQQHQHQQHHQQQPQPQMMYNPQQYAAAGSHQSPYGGGPGPGMGPNAGGMGMGMEMGMGTVQNGGLAHMAGTHGTMASYQTPYSSSPYGPSIPTSSAGNLNPNFLPTTPSAPSFSMNAPNMNPQQMQAQRMQPPPQSSTPTQPGQRASPYGSMSHNTPPNAPNAQSNALSQFNTPQNQSQPHPQTTNNTQQNQTGTPATPQSATFPPGLQGTAGSSMVTPLSPASEAREKDRVTILLEINRELLLEVMRLQAVQQAEKQAEKKEDAGLTTNSPDATEDKDKAEKEKTAKSVSQREYYECMRRLQGNLAYLAAIADRSHKPSSQIPPHPAVMSAPPLTSRPKKEATSSPSIETKAENASEDNKSVNGESAEDREDRIETLQDQYKRLQALFPGVDPKQDVHAQSANAAARAQMQAKQKQAQAQAQAQSHGGEQTPQQKKQTDLYRQHMMQQAQQQAAAAQQQAVTAQQQQVAAAQQNQQQAMHQHQSQNR